MSVNSKMTAIADEIRDKTGKTEALNLDQMAESIPEVYKAGQSSMVDESKLIPKTVSGSYISVDDVSEIPHTVQCKISGVDNPESVTVTRTRKNLFNKADVYKFYCDGSGKVISNDGMRSVIIPIPNKGSLTITQPKDGVLQRVGFVSEFPQNNTPLIYEGATAFTAYTDGMTISWDDAKINYAVITFWRNTSSYTETEVAETIQIELGVTATDYESHTAETYTSNADGTVEGMTSVSPYMNIFTDTEGANIEATYNKSWGMQTEYDRFWDSYQAKGNRKECKHLFSGRGWNNELFKPKYDMAVTNAYMMFMESSISGDLPKLLADAGVTLDFAECSNFQYAFSVSSFTRIGILDGRTGGSNSFLDTFNYSYYLRTIDKIISGENTKFSNNCFAYCNTLTNITFEGVIVTSINFQWSPLTKTSITNIINTLSATATGQTLTLKLSAVNTAFETSSGTADGSTSAEFAALVATKTNWTITMI